MKKTALLLLTAFTLASAQVNTWQRVVVNDTINWFFPAFFYSSAVNEFIMTMGTQEESGTNVPYCVQVYKPGINKFINALPHDTLYGKWADSTGYAYGNGRCGAGVFGIYSWAFKPIEGYLRPNTGAYKTPRAYAQFAVNTTDNKTYFYINNTTFSYDPVMRRWDTLTTTTHPNGFGVESFLKWGSMCYDGYNQEIVLCGGGAIDRDSSHLGTWTYKPSTRTWTELSLSVQPGPRANSSMAYDAENHVIVLFGGDRLDSYYGDTWIYDCVTRTWSQRHPSMNPTPHAGHALLYLPKSKKVVLAGGYPGAYELWAYDYTGNTWGLIKRFSGTDIWPKTAGAKCPASGLTAVDTGDFIVALGDSQPSQYYFRASVYRLQCDPSQIDAAGTAAYGIARDTTIWYNRDAWEDPAWYSTSVAEPDTAANEAFLRALSINTWYKISQPKVPGGSRGWSSTILDPEGDQFIKWGGGHVIHCGTDVPHYKISANRYSAGYRPEYPLDYDGDNECRPGPLTFHNRPFMNVHNTNAYNYDANIHRMIFVAGAHSYVYNPGIMDWDKVHIHSTFGGGGYNTGLAQTPHGVACLYGNVYGVNAVYLFDAGAMNWRKLNNSGATLPVYYADNSGVIYDSRRDRLIIAKGAYNETANLWSYSFATGVVTQLNASNSAIATGAEYYRDVVYLPHQDIVVWGIRQSAGHLAYDCAANAWINYPVAVDVSVGDPANKLTGRGSGYMYDARRNLAWVSDHYSNVYVMRPDAHYSALAKKNTPEIKAGLFSSPNPFNPSTRITLSLAVRARAELNVYDPSGKLVEPLFSGVLDRGNHGFVWNAAKHPSGLYVLRAKTGKTVFVRRIVLSK